jgi:hypothetical protein
VYDAGFTENNDLFLVPFVRNNKNHKPKILTL